MSEETEPTEAASIYDSGYDDGYLEAASLLETLADQVRAIVMRGWQEGSSAASDRARGNAYGRAMVDVLELLDRPRDYTP